MEDEIMVLNPKRKRRRRMSAAQRRYFGGGRRRTRRRRNPPTMFAANPHRRRRRSAGYVVGRGRVRRRKMNPVGGFLSGPVNVLTDAVPGTVGILLNNVVGNMAADAINATGAMRSAVKVVTAAFLPTVVGMVAPGMKRVATIAATAAIAHEAAGYLQKNVIPAMGPAATQLTADTDKAVGFLPGAQYIPSVGYLPGAQYVPSLNGGPFASRVPDMAGVGYGNY